jgi:quinol monooxygenase YgiN
MSIFVRARFETRDGRAAGFEQAANALREQAKAEPGTLTFRLFHAGEGAYVALEEYADTAAALAHQERAAALLERVAECAEMVSAELYGPIGPELQAWADSQSQVTVSPELPAPPG